MPRHKFVPLPLPYSSRAVAFCEGCGVLNNSGIEGCMVDDFQNQGTVV